MIIKNFVMLILFFVLLSLSFSCENSKFADIANSANSVDEPFDIIQEEYSVLKTLLPEGRESYVVLNEPPDEAFGINAEFFKVMFPEINSDTLNNYAERNRMPLKIDKPPNDFGYPVVNGKEFKKKLDKEGQYYEFSRVGFSNDGKQALVYFSNHCKALCGKGAYYLLKKEENNWKVAKESVAWLS